ncbi:hypothetical protein [Peptacetobacter sp. AB845]|uniref:hypothetical protein n=1 Tax=Peptacetobacter sp. AB845 TaxID=3388429 RepID=UPI0039C9298C
MFGILTKKKVREIEEQYKKELEEKDTRLQELKEFSDSKLKEMEENYNKSLLEKDEQFHKLNKEYELNLDLTDELNKEIGKLNKQVVRESKKAADMLGKIEKEKAIFLRTKSGRIKKKYAKKILEKLD